jgi:hypothetical protein
VKLGVSENMRDGENVSVGACLEEGDNTELFTRALLLEKIPFVTENPRVSEKDRVGEKVLVPEKEELPEKTCDFGRKLLFESIRDLVIELEMEYERVEDIVRVGENIRVSENEEVSWNARL